MCTYCLGCSKRSCRFPFLALWRLTYSGPVGRRCDVAGRGNYGRPMLEEASISRGGGCWLSTTFNPDLACAQLALENPAYF